MGTPDRVWNPVRGNVHRRASKGVTSSQARLPRLSASGDEEWMLYRFRFAGKFDNRITKYKFWQETNHAVMLDNTGLIELRINYTHENPVRAMIVFNAENYLYSSARDYAGEKGFVYVQTTL